MNCNYFLLSLFSFSVCILVGIDAHEAIIGGHIATFPLLPYQVTIILDDHIPKCGGGILSENYVLTAARCLIVTDGPLISRNILIRAGIYDFREAGILVKVQRVFVPREYDPRNPVSPSDISVLKLENPLPMNDSLLFRLITPRNRSNTYIDGEARIAGFGWDTLFQYANQLIGERNDNLLKYADTHVISNHECQRLLPHRHITEKHLCARVKPLANQIAHLRGTSVGDEGSPLVDNSHLRRVIGVLSVVELSNSEVTGIGIYTRITHAQRFLTHATKNYVASTMYAFDV